MLILHSCSPTKRIIQERFHISCCGCCNERVTLRFRLVRSVGAAYGRLERKIMLWVRDPLRMQCESRSASSFSRLDCCPTWLSPT
jgi:hypothetical protein